MATRIHKSKPLSGVKIFVIVGIIIVLMTIGLYNIVKFIFFGIFSTITMEQTLTFAIVLTTALIAAAALYQYLICICKTDQNMVITNTQTITIESAERVWNGYRYAHIITYYVDSEPMKNPSSAEELKDHRTTMYGDLLGIGFFGQAPQKGDTIKLTTKTKDENIRHYYETRIEWSCLTKTS